MKTYTCFDCEIKFQQQKKFKKGENILCNSCHKKDNVSSDCLPLLNQHGNDLKYFFDCMSCSLRTFLENSVIPEEFLVGERAYCHSCKKQHRQKENNYNSKCSWCSAPCYMRPNYKGKTPKCKECLNPVCSHRNCSNNKDTIEYFGFLNCHELDLSRGYLCFVCHDDQYGYD